ncbi:hypothetical protein Pelo_18285 [Pelomyxa schiedti]|nr:hypothetical protein Pelo_18285 [Pelomyxa schiedti]
MMVTSPSSSPSPPPSLQVSGGDEQNLLLAIRLLWDYCHQVTRLFCMPLSQCPTNCVAQFRVSEVLGSVLGDVHWVHQIEACSRRLIFANLCNMVELAAGLYLRNIKSHECWCLVDRVHSNFPAINAKWIVNMAYRGIMLIANIESEQRPQNIAVTVQIPESRGVQFFFRDAKFSDEGIMTIRSSPHSRTFELKRVQVAQSWATRKIAVLGSTKFQAEVDWIDTTLLMYKRTGSQVFILSAGLFSESGNKRYIIQVEEPPPTNIEQHSSACSVALLPLCGSGGYVVSQLSDSLFSVAFFTSERCDKLEIWDINAATTGPQRLIGCTGVDVSAFCEGGLIIKAGFHHGHDERTYVEPQHYYFTKIEINSGMEDDDDRGGEQGGEETTLVVMEFEDMFHHHHYHPRRR